MEKKLHDNKDARTAKLSERLREMAETDVRTVDRETLVDIADVKIDTSLPKEERIKEYVRQIKNPYCYLCHGVVVKVSFSGTRSIEDCLLECISMQS